MTFPTLQPMPWMGSIHDIPTNQITIPPTSASVPSWLQYHPHTGPAVFILSMAMSLLMMDALFEWPKVISGDLAAKQRALTVFTLVGVLATVTLNVTGWLCFGHTVLGAILLGWFVTTISVWSVGYLFLCWRENMAEMGKAGEDEERGAAKECCRVCEELEKADREEHGRENGSVHGEGVELLPRERDAGDEV